MDKLKVGVIGCGRMTSTIEDEVRGRKLGGIRLPHSHAAAYVTVDEVETGRRLRHHARQAEGVPGAVGSPPRLTPTFREMIDTEDLDILSIGTRPEQHAEPMIYGAENGIKGMYAEKPLCCTLDEADAIKDAFESNGVFPRVRADAPELGPCTGRPGRSPKAGIWAPSSPSSASPATASGGTTWTRCFTLSETRTRWPSGAPYQSSTQPRETRPACTS